MFDFVPVIGRVWRARRDYAKKCAKIEAMTELEDDERDTLKEAAKWVLFEITAKYAGDK